MFISSIQAYPDHLFWVMGLDIAMLLYLYGKGKLLIVLKDRYYGATAFKAFSDVTHLHIKD